jgi:hypothetical protein
MAEKSSNWFAEAGESLNPALEKVKRENKNLLI